jgi:hypothetical protein
MTVLDICENYLSARACSTGYAQQMRRLATKLPELKAEAINVHIRVRGESVSETSVANERRMALTLWRWAYEEGIVDLPPRGVRRVSVRAKAVRAWTIAECQNLVKSTAKFSSVFLRNGANVGEFLRTWVVLGYETGARYGDVFGWTQDNIRGQTMSWVTSKTGVVCTRSLSDEAVELAKSMLKKSSDGTILGWVACRRHSFKLMHGLIKESLGTGSGKWLRRSAATHVEMGDPGKAQWFLGHRTPGLAARHYLDQSQLSGAVSRPPSLH